MQIRRLPELSGDILYEARFSGGSTLQTVHLPNGTIVTAPFGGRLESTYSSFDALRSAFVGTWTLEFPAFGSRPQEFYTFEFSDFPESVLYSVPPVITSPANGSLVPVDFVMTWQWPVDVTPPAGRSTLVQRFGPDSHLSERETSGTPENYLSWDVSSRHGDGTVAETVIVRAGDFNIDTLVPYMSAVTPQQAVYTWDFTLRSFFRSYSTPVTVYPIPEPLNLASLATGLGILIFYRCRYSSQQKTPLNHVG
jgi:hypothetical protein